MTKHSILILLWLALCAFELQGHRGARGERPENSMTGFRHAAITCVDTLEMDLGITADGVVVVSHDRRLDPAITRDPEGRWLLGETPPIHDLTWRQLETYDVGRIDPSSDYAERFPEQIPHELERIPRLEQVIHESGDLGLNLEIKTSPEHPGDTLDPRTFARIVAALLQETGAAERATIQSFHWDALQEVQEIAPEIPTVYLTAQRDWLDNVSPPSAWSAGFDLSQHGGSVPRMVKAAGGAVWSPYHKDLTQETLQEAQALGLRVIPWTVNEVADRDRLVAWGVDGLITDFPSRFCDP
ncbi:MAG: glycerophosphodiester phosphodiesterase [Pseudomonadota bacterium]